MQFLKRVRKKIHKTLLEYPAYVKMLEVRDRVAKRILAALLTFFDVIGPFLTLLCTKKPDTQSGPSTGIM